MTIRFITDSASDMQNGIRPDLTVLPMQVTFGEESYEDGVTLSHTEFYEKLVECDSLPTTSQIAPGAFADAFRTAVEAGETVIAVTMSSKLSGTCQSAMIAAADFPGRVFVVDSENVSIGEHALMEYAFSLKDAGRSVEEIVDALNREKKNIRLIALLDTLEYLKRGGRIPKTAAAIGGLLSIKPVICIRDGEVAMLGKARGSKNCSNLLVEQISKAGGIDFSMPLLLGYTGLSDSLLRKYIEDSAALWKDQRDSLTFSTIGGTIGTHIGPGTIALAFFCAS